MLHRHHIIPRHAGGDDSPGNIALLTVEEHADAHLERWMIYGDSADLVAYQMLSGQIGVSEAILQATLLANVGRKLSDETKRKMSIARRERAKNPTEGMRRGWKASAETKRGKAMPASTGEKIRAANIERWKSPEYRARAIESAKRASTEEVRDKIRRARAKQVISHSEETRKKMSESWTDARREANPLKGRKRSAEVCRKISEGHKGKPKSEEHKAKISATRKARFAKRRVRSIIHS